jgi:hypothetical protein
MRESRSYGSVRGVAGDRYPYRDLQKPAIWPVVTCQHSKAMASFWSMGPPARILGCSHRLDHLTYHL